MNEEATMRTNMIVGTAIEWTTSVVGRGGDLQSIAYQGRVLDSQLEDGQYLLLVEPKKVCTGAVYSKDGRDTGWRDASYYESTLRTVKAVDCHVPMIDKGELPGDGYRAPAEGGVTNEV